MELPAARRLFALDHGFPQPIVEVLADYTPDVELIAIEKIDERMPDLDDWEVLLTLHHHPDAWDGLVTTDSSMVQTPESLAVLMQTKLTLVVAMEAGHDMLKATGLLFAYLPGILGRTDPAVAQLWKLQAENRPHIDPWKELQSVAEHQDRPVNELWNEARLPRTSSPATLLRRSRVGLGRRPILLRRRCLPLGQPFP
jgi:hypothetical protein